MAWITPNTGWSTGDGVGMTDFNRIEGNTEYLYNQTRTLRRYIQGFELSASSNSFFSISPGDCLDDESSDQDNIQLSSMIVKNSSAWTAGSGVGGVAPSVTMSVNTWYYIFAIKNPTNGFTDIQIDDNPEGTNIYAFGYTRKRRVGTIKTGSDALNFLQQYSKGDTYYIAGSDDKMRASKTVTHTSEFWELEDGVGGRLTPSVEIVAFGVFATTTVEVSAYLWPSMFGLSANFYSPGIIVGLSGFYCEMPVSASGEICCKTYSNLGVNVADTEFKINSFIDTRGRDD